MADEGGYKLMQSQCKSFLNEYRTFDDPSGQGNFVFKYKDILRAIHRGERNMLPISVDDVRKWGQVVIAHDVDNIDGPGAQPSRENLREGIRIEEEMVMNSRRFVELFSAAADELLEEIRSTDTSAELDMNSRIAVLRETRRQREQEYRRNQASAENMPDTANENVNQPAAPGADPRNLIPPEATRMYQTLLIPAPSEKTIPIRHVRAEHVGRLVTITGIVTRVTEVKPRVSVAAYQCNKCGFEIFQQVPGRNFMPVTTCPAPEHAGRHGTAAQVTPNYAATKYVKFQELKLQEPADQVPIGSIPRSITVKLNGEVTRTCTAGDSVAISGIFLPMPYTGYRAMKAGYLADTYVDATQVTQMKKNYGEEVVTREMEDQLHELRHDDNLYGRLSKSIAPEIFGHEDVKKALLLLLVGAPPKKMPDGMRLRGDLHMCLMGDPGVAKSQLLKHITKVAPRAVYTTGKGSSGVGLTAAVMRDPVTNELMLEGGALVLADMGIACIDEFDKMNEVDRTAIHEVMEQQTVSIAKAGITTSLNARSAVLAAANPAYGRYNKKRTPAENINLPAALLSRFDLLFLLLDKAKAEQDLALAKHITHVHRTGVHPPLGFDVVDPKLIRLHIAKARATQPVIPPDGVLTEYLVNNYVAMRAAETEAGTDAKGYTTARSLLSILRLSQALARLRFATEVEKHDVDEAMRLMKASKESLDDDDEGGNIGNGGFGDGMDTDDDDDVENITWKIYSIIAEFMQTNSRTAVDIETAEKLCDENDIDRNDLMRTIEEYVDLNLWTYDYDSSRIISVMTNV
eukprot:Plantae.Rhodophyta-Hildenbrandia_rubra.ctg19878.p1 GENE.Plantae.Rhodophyta-Hildenbrandia_rubra.ctg19878~~Plantae.Rhodophyta-Hildenbrandia_rubra.ctg19878.p1  ORF type:complete len:801 (-),score=178.83 Plantae.Rhodophyta-Hildenbrandia_rubra.ctg19878:266-2668(-)